MIGLAAHLLSWEWSPVQIAAAAFIAAEVASLGGVRGSGRPLLPPRRDHHHDHHIV